MHEEEKTFLSPEERTDLPRSLFFLYCAANIGILGLVYGAIIVGYQLSFLQAVRLSGQFNPCSGGSDRACRMAVDQCLYRRTDGVGPICRAGDWDDDSEYGRGSGNFCSAGTGLRIVQSCDADPYADTLHLFIRFFHTRHSCDHHTADGLGDALVDAEW